MSLASRCPSCGTVFRVVPDQLRVSEGWVRCGRCNGVFNAAEVLFDIDTGEAMQLDLGSAGPATPAAGARPPGPPPGDEAPAPPAPPLPPSPPSPPAPPLGFGTGLRQEPHFDEPSPHPADPGGWPAAAASTGRAAAAPEGPLLRAPSRRDDEDDEAEDPLGEIVITDHVPAPQAADGLAPGALAAAAAARALPASPVQAVPSFLRTADRTAVWRRPVVRAALAAGVAVLALVLVLQLALVWRDTLAARLPAAEPALQALCRMAGCQVQPLRRIETLSVHSSGLNRLEGSSLYRLQVVLHNGADTAVMMPALDLSLTDGQGRLVARRVLTTAELGVARPVLQAGEELPIKALVSTGERRVDGYTLELFYP